MLLGLVLSIKKKERKMFTIFVVFNESFFKK
jgi:hypothetical protein